MFDETLKKSLNNRYVKNFKKDTKLIIAVMAVVMIWMAIYLVTFYKPTFKSRAKVLIKDISTQEYITTMNQDSDIKSITSVGNPILNQVEILKSYQLTNFLFNYIKQNYPDKVQYEKNKEKYVRKILKTKNIGGTDVILVSLLWENPQEAQKILNIVLNKYQEINLGINKEIRTNRRVYIDQKVDELEKKLLEVRQKIKIYKEGTLTIDLKHEAEQLINQKMDFSSKLASNAAAINNAAATVRELEKSLSMNSRQALDAVALGWQNANLVDIKSKLYDAIQQYSYDSIKYAPTNPKIIAQKNRIEILKAQLNEQIESAVGKSGYKGKGIYDSTRAQLVANLIAAKTNLMGLKAERQIIKDSIGRNNGLQYLMPEKQYTLENLQQEADNLSSAYNELKKKQMEARIKEAEAVSNSVVIDPPSLPDKASFPTMLHEILAAIVLGALLGLGASYLKTYAEDICEGAEAIEEVTGAPVLGVIPWLKNQQLSLHNTSIQKIAYDNILSSFMIRCYNNDAKIISFSSTALKKTNSIALYTLASALKKTGSSVAVIDADLRSPVIHKNAKVSQKIKVKLSDLILNIEKNVKQNHVIDSKLILSALVRDENGVYILANNTEVREPYEYFGTTAFSVIIKTLKDHFDWILIDTPPAAVAPEFPIISRLSNGVVLLANLTATYSILQKITRLIKNNNIPLLGTIIRERDSQIEKEYADYIWLNPVNMNTPAGQSKSFATLTNVGSSAGKNDNN